MQGTSLALTQEPTDMGAGTGAFCNAPFDEEYTRETSMTMFAVAGGTDNLLTCEVEYLGTAVLITSVLV